MWVVYENPHLQQMEQTQQASFTSLVSSLGYCWKQYPIKNLHSEWFLHRYSVSILMILALSNSIITYKAN